LSCRLRDARVDVKTASPFEAGYSSETGDYLDMPMIIILEGYPLVCTFGQDLDIGRGVENIIIGRVMKDLF